MKILFLGDASNYHSTLAKALRDNGHSVTLASNGSHWMNTERDIDLSRPNNGRLGGLSLYARMRWKVIPQIADYDIVQIHNPVFADLRPQLNLNLFNHIKRKNCNIYLTALGTDTEYVRYCLDSDTLRYNEWRVGTNLTDYAINASKDLHRWFAYPMNRLNNKIYGSIDGIVAALYEYYKCCQDRKPDVKLAYGGIPIDTATLNSVHGDKVPDIVEIFIGLQKGRTLEKGTDRLLEAAKRVVARNRDHCRLTVVENLPYNEYVERMRSAHVLLDQLYSYTPATNALIAMSQGLVAVTGAEPEFYDFIGENQNRPMVNAVPDDDEELTRSIEAIVRNREALPRLSRMSREFVIKHNDSHVVARRFEKFWKK